MLLLYRQEKKIALPKRTLIWGVYKDNSGFASKAVYKYRNIVVRVFQSGHRATSRALLLTHYAANPQRYIAWAGVQKLPRTSAQHLTRSAQDNMSTLETISEKPSVDVTFTEQSLHVQLTLHTAGTVWLDCVEPQSAAHGRVNVGTSLVAVQRRTDGETIWPAGLGYLL